MAKLLPSHRLSPTKITAAFVLRPLSTFHASSPIPAAPSSLFAPSSKPRRILYSRSSYSSGLRRDFSTCVTGKDVDEKGFEALEGNGGLGVKDEEYPTGEFEMEEFGWWRTFAVKVRMLLAFPWERVKKGSVLSIKLKGQVCAICGSSTSVL